MSHAPEHTVAAGFITLTLAWIIAPDVLAREPGVAEPHAIQPRVTAATRLPRQRRVAAPTREVPAHSASPAVPEHWYGWEIGIVDGGSLAIMAMGLGLTLGNDSDDGESDDTGFAIFRVGFAGYLALGPVLHAAHARPVERVLGSVGLRIGLPIAGAGLGAAATVGCNSSGGWGNPCQAAGAGVGMLIGMVGAMVTDAALSFEPVETVSAASASIRLAPALHAARGRTLLGVAGAF